MSPFGPYDDFADCVSQSQDKSNPEAFCAWLHHEILGAWPAELSSSMPKEAYDIYLKHYASHLTGNKEPVLKAEKEANAFAVSELEKVGWQLSRIGWVRTFEAPKMRTVLNVKVFATGKWTDSMGIERDWKDADLDKLVDAFQAGVPAIVPLKAGHTPDSFNNMIAEALGVPVDLITGLEGQGQVSLGRMATLERRGSLLIASFERVPEKVADFIEGGQFSTVSVEIEDKVGSFGPVLTAVAMLGVEEPAVEDATLDRALVFGGKREGAAVLTFSTKDVTPEELENEFAEVQEKFEGIIKGKRGAPIFRALAKQLRALFDQIKKKGGEHTAQGGKMKFHTVEDRLRGMRYDLGLAEDATIEDALAAVQALATELQAHPNKKEALKMGDDNNNKQKLQLPEEITALAVALGLPEGASMADILQAVESLKQKIAEMPALKTLQEKVETLEHEARVTGYQSKVSKFTSLAGKPEEMAAELASVEEKADKETAEKMLASYQVANDAQAAAIKVTGTSRSGEKALDFETAVSEYQKEHADATRGEAVKAIMKSQPQLYKEARNESRRLAKELENK